MADTSIGSTSLTLKLSASAKLSNSPLRSLTTSVLPSNDSTVPRRRCVGLAAGAWPSAQVQAKARAAVSQCFMCGAGPSAAANPTQRLRGTVESFDGSTLVVKERSGELLSLALADNFSVSEVLPIEVSAIQAGSFVGSAAVPAVDGTLRALEVLVFPEAARGTGEGHVAWDLQPGSTMTNATVADVVTTAEGRSLKLRYKDGEKTIQVPEGVPIVTFKPGDRSLLVAGAKVLVTAQLRDGKPTALRVLVGRNGFAPPM